MTANRQRRSPAQPAPHAWRCPSAGLGAALSGICLCAGLYAGIGAGASAASAAECYPHCDYNHYYGPYDFSYIRPGLYAYPVCGPRGRCAPHLVYGYSGLRYGTIEVRFPRRTRAPRH
jgi:hypothetical protein